MYLRSAAVPSWRALFLPERKCLGDHHVIAKRWGSRVAEGGRVGMYEECADASMIFAWQCG